mgnify:CR=1 FL=1
MTFTFIPVDERSDFVPVADGVEVSRSIADAQTCSLGGGNIRFVTDGVLDGVLEYDEVVHVLTGRVTLTVDDQESTGGPGDTFLLVCGSTARYAGTAGTELFYVINPRPDQER